MVITDKKVETLMVQNDKVPKRKKNIESWCEIGNEDIRNKLMETLKLNEKPQFIVINKPKFSNGGNQIETKEEQFRLAYLNKDNYLQQMMNPDTVDFFFDFEEGQNKRTREGIVYQEKINEMNKFGRIPNMENNKNSWFKISKEIQDELVDLLGLEKEDKPDYALIPKATFDKNKNYIKSKDGKFQLMKIDENGKIKVIKNRDGGNSFYSNKGKVEGWNRNGCAVYQKI